MSDDNTSDENPKETSEHVWNEVRSAMDNVFERDLTPEEFYFLLSQYPYLEICDADYPYLDEGAQPTVVTLDNGWRIFDFESVLSSSGYELACRPQGKPLLNGNDEEDERGGGNGTVVKQYADVAFEMIALAIKKGWTGAEIISGFYPMQRMAWIAAWEKSYELKGFDPTAEDYVVQDWVSRMREGKLYSPGKIVTGQRHTR